MVWQSNADFWPSWNCKHRLSYFHLNFTRQYSNMLNIRWYLSHIHRQFSYESWQRKNFENRSVRPYQMWCELLEF